MTDKTPFNLISPVCPQHKLFLETREEELQLDGVQVKPGDALSTIVVPVWSKLTLHAVITRDGLSTVWRVFAIETDLARASDDKAAKEVLEGFKKMANQLAESYDDEIDNSDHGDTNGSEETMESASYETPTTGEAPVSAPEHGN